MKHNKSQMVAISHRDGPMMVLAGPGSGKTTVITRRIERLIQEGVEPSKILVITFSKAASVEMKERFLKIYHQPGCPVWFGTFHAVFFRILREAYHYDVNNIITVSLKRRFIEEAIRESEMKNIELTDFVEEMEKEISNVKGSGIDITYYYSTSCPEETFREIYRSYEKKLRVHKQLDFDDMIVMTNHLLKENVQLLQRWQQTFSYILIDEFQDINALQFENICRLAEPENNLFIVGDDDQSIYGFRGARPDLMLEFPKRFPGTKRVTLEDNYRCSSQILSAATRLIRHNKRRYQKDLVAVKGKDESIRITKCKNLQRENQAIVEWMMKYHEMGIDYREIAVLFRTNMQSRTLVGKLAEYNIPFYMKERLPNLFEHFIAKDILAYLYLGEGARNRQYFLRIANKPKRYLNHDAFRDEEIRFADLYSYYQNKEWMEEYLDDFQRDLIHLRDLPPFAAIEYIRKQIGYDAYLHEYANYRGVKPDDWLALLDDLQESAHSMQSLEEWLQYIEEYTRELEEGKKRRENNEDAVQIMTMHGAKGLEFDTVFIPDVNDGVIPYRKAVLEEDLEEERRMLYVAMTRAKRHLHLSFVEHRYNKDANPSPFLYEISSKLKRGGLK